MEQENIQPPVKTITREQKTAVGLLIFAVIIFLASIQFPCWAVAAGIKLVIWRFKKDFEFPKAILCIDACMTRLINCLGQQLQKY